MLRNLYYIKAVLLIIFLSGTASAQIPDKFINLTVLPGDISKQDLREVMKNFTSSLGVRCNYCHAGKDGMEASAFDLKTIDFASDKIPAKDITRVMMKMTQSINNDHLTLIKEKNHIEKVECVTCHKGMKEPPKKLENILLSQVEKKGIDTTLKKYDELREKYYTGYVYDFTFKPLSAFSEGLIKANKNEDVINFFTAYLNKYDGNSWNAYLEMGKAYANEKKYEEAKKSYDKALEISPGNENVMWFYKKLKEGMNK